MVDCERGVGRLLLVTREEPAFQRGAIAFSIFILAISFTLAYFTRFLHFFGLSFIAIALLAWLGGWRAGLVAGLAIPIIGIPISIFTGYPSHVILVDTTTFLFMTLVCGGAVGLISSLFKYSASTQMEIKKLRRILHICSHCHRIRENGDEWTSFEAYFDAHSKIRFSHGVCTVCAKEHYDK